MTSLKLTVVGFNDNMPWHLICHGREPHGKESYDVAFCPMTNGEAGSLFCTVGGNQLTVYSANKDKTTSPLLCFIDQEADESYYCCAWLVDSGTGDLLIAVGGIKSSIKVVNCNTNSLHQHLVGHGNSINHLVRLY